MSKLALFGGTPLIKNHADLRIEWPITDTADFQAVREAFDDKDFSGRGSKRVFALEDAFSKKFDGMYATALNSGTAAIHAALKALDIGPGDEVIVPNLTFVATALAVIHAMAIPVFADVDDNYNLSVNTINDVLSEKTKAIIVVHMHGFAADIEKIRAFCDLKGLLLIEDVAQAPNGRYNGKLLGTFGDASAFSLMSQKNLATCGEAGILLTRTREQKNKAEMLRIYGEIIAQDGSRIYNSYSLGWNYTLNPIQAAMALTRLKKLDALTVQIQERGRKITDELAKISWLAPPEEISGSESVFHFYRVAIQSPDTTIPTKIFRQAVQDALNAEGLNVRHYQNTPISGQIIFQDRIAFGAGLPWSLGDRQINYSIDQFPNTLRILQETFVLGAISSFPGYLLQDGTVDKYIEGFKKIDENLPEILSYAQQIDYHEPWESIPVTSDSFRATYGTLGN
jgi:dTDP-4-amino-4,6-dideoxygalactose transaminase